MQRLFRQAACVTGPVAALRDAPEGDQKVDAVLAALEEGLLFISPGGDVVHPVSDRMGELATPEQRTQAITYLASISAISDGVNCTGVLYAEQAGHEASITEKSAYCNKRDLTLSCSPKRKRPA